MSGGMSQDRWRRVQELFHAASDRAPHERDAFLEDMCADDADLRREVNDLLAADAQGGGALDRGAEGFVRLLSDDVLNATVQPDAAGRRVGPYSIVRMLGRGGMGAVYLAERTDVGLRCALKLVRGGLAAPETVERFLLERRVLARLEHAHIARMLDAGVTEDGTPWFAMELVEGERIDRYCDARRLSIAERLRLFEKVCEAVAYAHRNLIVHRDLKPSNIMVSESAGPKLLDFGIAKLLEDDFEEGLTGTGMRLLTPGYAAPEQLTGGHVTTATDVYALGLVLYELLSGHRATAGARVAAADAPPLARPSTAVTRAKAIANTQGETRTITPEEVAAARSTEPAQLRRRIAGDLDAIVMRALAPEPERRYGTAAELLEDLVRHREALPVRAQVDTWPYRTRRFIRRNRASVAIAATLVLALGTLAASMTVQQAATARERDRAQDALALAETEATKAKQVSDFLVELFDVTDPFSVSAVRADSLTVRDFMIARGEKVLALKSQPEVQLQAYNVVGHMYFTLGLYDRAGPMYDSAIALGRRLNAKGSDALVTALINKGDLHRARSEFAASEAPFREAVTMARQLHPGMHKSLARALNGLGEGYRQLGNYAAAEPIMREALAARRQVYGERSTDAADAMNNLGLLLWSKGDNAGAEPMLEQAQSIQREKLPPVHPMISATLNNLGLVKKANGDLAGAEAALREAMEIKRQLFGRTHWRVANGILNLAGVLLLQGRVDESQTLSAEALAITREAFGDKHELIGVSLMQLGEAREKKQDWAGAERYFRQSLAAQQKATPPGHPRITAGELTLGRFLVTRRRFAEARPLLESAAARYLATDGDNHQRTMRARAWLGACLTSLGQYDLAEPHLVRAVAYYREKGTLRGDDESAAIKSLADLYEARGDRQRAAESRALLVGNPR